MSEATTPPEVFTTEEPTTDGTHAGIEVDHGGGHAEPELFGLAPFQIVAVAMAVLILIMVWKKVPGMITGGLDAKIDAIRSQLDEAKKLRAEAEALRDEYKQKIAGAEKDAASMMENAQREADAILEKAEADSAAPT